MGYPNQLKSARITGGTPIAQGPGKVGLAEQAVADALGIPIDVDFSAAVALKSSERVPGVNAPNQETETLTAGEAFSAGELGYLKSDEKVWKAKADAEATSGPVRLFLATASISGGASGVFLRRGYLTVTGWNWGTKGGALWVSAATAGLMTQTKPSANGNIVRPCGYADGSAANTAWFDPSRAWGELVV